MAAIPSPTNGSNGTNGHKPRERIVTPEEGQHLIRVALLATMDATQDVAAEQTWQQHARLLLKHTERFIETLGMVQVLKMQQMCADMVIKIRLASKKTDTDGGADVLQEYEQMLEAIFTQAPQVPGDDFEEEEG